ncbi:replication factor A protein 3 [Vararia minispora EC-137]|uniref:Replication factor A protein 3 n=1 Tax=Vararia minispora EC-137 TaxID=1314806 RepID=A0ACB8QI80_9AGAM|nr:replication factor A protein 3 [Vararia minispora EC-137]
MSEFATPRINSAALGQYEKHTIRVVGKVKEIPDSTHAVLEASDSGIVNINALPMQVESLRNVTYAEIIGEVVDPVTIRYQSHSDLGSNIDLKLVDEVIQQCMRFMGRIF